MDIIIEILDNANNDGILHVIESYQPLDYYILLISHTFLQKWVLIGNETYRSDKRHSYNDLPALVLLDSTQAWYRHDQVWYKNDKIHRDNDLPAVICPSGEQYWLQNNRFHRDNNLPAMVCPNGFRAWFRNGLQYKPNI